MMNDVSKSFEEIRVIDDLPELHQDVGDLLVHARLQVMTGLGTRHELVIEESLTFGQGAHDDVLVFLRKLFLDVALESTEEVWTQDHVKL